MPLTKTKLSLSIAAALVLASAAACGPESREESDWMYDTFSAARSAGEVFTASGLTKVTFSEDGSGTISNVSACGRDESTNSFVWERRSGEQIAIVPPAGEDTVLGGPHSEWRFTMTNNCTPEGASEVRWEMQGASEAPLVALLFRGNMCLERFECSDTEGDSQCDDCRTYWCDTPPPECSDE